MDRSYQALFLVPIMISVYYGLRLIYTDCDLQLASASQTQCDKLLKGKRIWITGASSGIGKELALYAARKGAIVLLSSRNEQSLKEVVKEIESFGGLSRMLVVDLNEIGLLGEKCEMAKELFEADVDILVNNAGVVQRSYAIDMKRETEEYILNVDFVSATILSKSLIKGWKKRDEKESTPKGIINIGSLSGKAGLPLRSYYCAAKFALLGFMDALRCELGSEENITITNVCPGGTRTNASKNALKGEFDCDIKR
jgi:short-subunit dehydrogenase